MPHPSPRASETIAVPAPVQRVDEGSGSGRLSSAIRRTVRAAGQMPASAQAVDPVSGRVAGGPGGGAVRSHYDVFTTRRPGRRPVERPEERLDRPVDRLADVPLGDRVEDRRRLRRIHDHGSRSEGLGWSRARRDDDHRGVVASAQDLGAERGLARRQIRRARGSRANAPGTGRSPTPCGRPGRRRATRLGRRGGTRGPGGRRPRSGAPVQSAAARTRAVVQQRTSGHRAERRPVDRRPRDLRVPPGDRSAATP